MGDAEVLGGCLGVGADRAGRCGSGPGVGVDVPEVALGVEDAGAATAVGRFPGGFGCVVLEGVSNLGRRHERREATSPPTTQTLVDA